MLELYQNIKARRIELGLSQSQLAEMTGYADKTAISHIENGKRDISHSKLMGHASYEMTLKVYTNLSDDDILNEKIFDAVNLHT